LAELANGVPTSAHVEHYAKIVKDLATKRNLISAASRIVEASFEEGMAADELLDKAESPKFFLFHSSIFLKLLCRLRKPWRRVLTGWMSFIKNQAA